MRGGLSITDTVAARAMFVPHTRGGLSTNEATADLVVDAFPTHVGGSPSSRPRRGSTPNLPHSRGGRPSIRQSSSLPAASSPDAWESVESDFVVRQTARAPERSPTSAPGAPSPGVQIQPDQNI